MDDDSEISRTERENKGDLLILTRNRKEELI